MTLRVPIPTRADVEKLFADTQKKAERALNSLKRAARDAHEEADKAFDDLRKSGEEVYEEANKALEDLKKRGLKALDEAGEEKNKRLALVHARSVSYVMTGKSGAQFLQRDVEDWLAEKREDKDHKSRRVQSILGGAFLRMYLDHEVDSGVIEDVSGEIKVSPEFKVLQSELQGWLTLQRSRFAALKDSEEQIRKEIARIALLKLRAKLAASGIAFRHELNPVIGGVSDINVGEVSATVAVTEEGTAVDYQVDVVFSDTYDFDNVRTGEYDAYRKKLALLLRQGKYGEFWQTYEREASGALGISGTGRKTQLDEASVFASFMYAIERKGWTPGPLAWDVTVPMEGSFVITAK